MKKILFATSNEAKVKRFKDKLLAKGIELLSLSCVKHYDWLIYSA